MTDLDPGVGGVGPAFAAIDLGASSGRVVLGLVDGAALRTEVVHRFGNGPVEVDGELRWETSRLFDESLIGLAKAYQAARRQGARLAGIGVDSWGVDYGLLDAEGRFDGRSKHYLGADAAEPDRAAALVDARRAYQTTGVLTQHINTAYQLRTDRARGAALAGSTVLLTPDLWVWLLTGRIGAEHTIASTTQLFDPSRRQWSAELIEAWGLDALVFPEPAPPGTLAGTTTEEITARIGASEPIPVYRVAQHDTASALSFARPGSGELLISSGSWSLVGMSMAEPVRTEAAREAGYTNELGAAGSVLVLRNLAGMLLLGQCIRAWSAKDSRGYEPVALLAEAAAAAGDGPVARFDVGDPRLLSTDDVPGMIVTLCLEHGGPAPEGRIGIVRAIVESLAQAYADAVRSCTAVTGVPVRVIRIVGGGSRNTELCRRTAELAGVPVLAGPVEASALGNLAVQLVAAGLAPDIATVFESATGSADEEIIRYEPGGPVPAAGRGGIGA